MGRSLWRVCLGACLAGSAAAPVAVRAEEPQQYAALIPRRPSQSSETAAPSDTSTSAPSTSSAMTLETPPPELPPVPVDEAPEIELAPKGFTGRSPIPPSISQGDFLPLQDRWRIGFPTNYRPEVGGFGHVWDPYNQNVLKGDYPFWGQDKFISITATSDTLFEARTLPTPSGISSREPDQIDFFGSGKQYLINQNFILSISIFQGDAGYKPKDWEIRLTPVANINYVQLDELGGVDPDVREGRYRGDEFIGFQEAFVEARIPGQSRYFDFTSARAGIQGFVSDFKGFLFSDFEPGVRLFGNMDNNRIQWNLAWFHPLEKDTNSGLNSYTLRDQNIFIANIFFQDSLKYFKNHSTDPNLLGYTTEFSFHANLDNSGNEIQLDDNGFVVRPEPIGTIADKAVRAYYLGWGGDGHIGRFNLSHQFYQAFGEETFNAIAGQSTNINAQFFSIELSYDADWLRFRTSFLWSSGDHDPTDSDANGFDSIFDNPNFAGGGFSFYQRQAIALTGTGVGLKGRNSIVPDLRTSKDQGQANFVNPGLFMYNVGLDAEITPKLKAITNVSWIQFADTKAIQQVLFDDKIGRDLGIDYSIGLQYRPFLNNNVIFVVGGAIFQPLGGYKDIYQSQTEFSAFTSVTLTY